VKSSNPKIISIYKDIDTYHTQKDSFKLLERAVKCLRLEMMDYRLVSRLKPFFLKKKRRITGTSFGQLVIT
jgi:hypothetical protein